MARRPTFVFEPFRGIGGNHRTGKVGEKSRSARDLCDTIDDQLVKKYMAHREARTGCLVVTVANPEKYWHHPDTGARIDQAGL